MNDLVTSFVQAPAPALIRAAGDKATDRFWEFFVGQIRNHHTRRAYAKAVGDFFRWAEDGGLVSILALRSFHVAAYVELLGKSYPAPTVKQRLAAIRRVLDYMTTGGLLDFNPAAAVKSPRYSVKRGKTPVLASEEARQVLDAIDVSKLIGLRDRALIGLMVYSFARIGAVVAMKVEDVFVQNRRLWVRLHEKGGKLHEMPCHHNLEQYLHEYLEAAGLRDRPKAPLFGTLGRKDRKAGGLTETPLPQRNAYAMVERRAGRAEIATRICNHTFRATGITAYLKNGGTLEKAATMANHASTRTTQLYDRRPDDITLDEIERVII